MEITEDEISLRLESDPGDPVFADYAEFLRSQGDYDRALHVCLSGITSNPAVLEGRLVLARIFYDEGYKSFAIRELEFLKKELPDNKALISLLEKVSPESLSQSSKHESINEEEGSTVAEGEFAFDELDLLEEDSE